MNLCMFSLYSHSCSTNDLRYIDEYQEILVKQREDILTEQIINPSHQLCQFHRNKYLLHYNPTTCIFCNSSSSSSSSLIKCPQWICEQLYCCIGSKIHRRPCYQEYIAAHSSPKNEAKKRKLELEQTEVEGKENQLNRKVIIREMKKILKKIYFIMIF